MKHSFQVITVAIIVLLTLVLCGQIFWMHRLYRSIRQETVSAITSVVETADFNELAARIKAKNRKEMKRSAKQEKNFSFAYNFALYSQSPLTLMRLVNGGIHGLIDPVEPINFKEFCRIIQSECKAKGIDIDVSEVMFRNHKTGTTLRYHSPGKRVTDADVVTYHNVEGNYTYTVWVSPLTSVYLYRMQGIIFTTVLIILLLAVSFWYLIHTIVRLRSIEEMKDDFTNNMTHELKTPIAVTYSAVDALLHFKQGDDKEKRVQYLKICEEQMKRLSGLVEQILSMSMERRKTLKMNKENVKLRPMMDRLTDDFHIKSHKEIRFSIDIQPDDMTVYADPVHFFNAVSNIIDNSVKYSGDAVAVRIHAYRDADRDYIVLTDDGIGISDENQPHVFDKFYRVGHGNQYNVSGYGLGLYYVQQIIERHGGSISVESVVNEGTTFTITLPVK